MRKTAFILLFITLFSIALFSQVTRVNAQEAPITPITYMISGKVTYQFFHRLFAILGGPFQTSSSAAGVTVQATDIITGQTFSTITDSNGDYTLGVPQTNSILFKVSPQGGQANVYVAPLQIVTSNHNQNNVNFQGYVFQ